MSNPLIDEQAVSDLKLKLANPEYNFAAIRENYSIEESWALSRLLSSDIEDKYLIDGMIVEQQPMVIAGPSKAMKTTLATAIALCIASGKDLLHFKTNDRRRVHFCSAESGKATTKKTICALAQMLDIELHELDGWITFDWWVPKSSNLEMMAYFSHCVRSCGATVSIIDPLYQTLDDQQASVIANGQQLASLGQQILKTGALPIMLDHTKRSSENTKNYQPLQLEDVSGAGKAEFFRQWVLLGRRERFEPGSDGTHQHKLWLTLGGSAGHASQWALDITELNSSPTDRQYGFEIESYGSCIEASKEQRKEAGNSKQEAKQVRQTERIQRKAKELIEVVYAKDMTLALTGNDIEARLQGVSSAESSKVVGYCLQEKWLVARQKCVTKNGKAFDGYMLPNTIFSAATEAGIERGITGEFPTLPHSSPLVETTGEVLGGEKTYR